MALRKVWKQGRGENTKNSPLWKDACGNERQEGQHYVCECWVLVTKAHIVSPFLTVQCKPSALELCAVNGGAALTIEHLSLCRYPMHSLLPAADRMLICLDDLKLPECIYKVFLMFFFMDADFVYLIYIQAHLWPNIAKKLFFVYNSILFE